MRGVERRVQRILELQREHWTAVPGLHYQGPADFALREGEWFAPAPEDGRYPKGALRLCFNNAINASIVLGLPYVEGYACAGRTAPVVAHAWVLDPQGRAVDVTWPAHPQLPSDDRAYLGVRFSARRADDCSWEGDATVFDDWQRGWPLLREPWHGEDSPGDVDGLLELMARRYLASGRSRLALTAVVDGIRQFWTTGEHPFAREKGDAA